MLNFKRATKTKACCNCKHCKHIRRDKHMSCYCEKHKAKMGYVCVIGMQCDDWEEWK